MYLLYSSEASTVKPATEFAIKATKLFIESLKRKETPEKAARHLGNTTKEDVMRWVDDKELDLLHHTIILNNPEAVQYLFTHGFFQVGSQTNHFPSFLLRREGLGPVVQS